MLLEINENKAILEELIFIDNNIMKDNITYLDIVNFSENDQVIYQELQNKDNILILYDGEITKTIRILKSLNNCSRVLLHPNYSYLGINSFLVKISGRDIYLIEEKNTNKYIPFKDKFNEVYVVGVKEEYEEYKREFPNSLLIEEI